MKLSRRDRIHGGRWMLSILIASPWWSLGRDWWIIDGWMWFFVAWFLTIFALPAAVLHDKGEARWVRALRENQPAPEE